jgi:hypothetical protein
MTALDEGSEYYACCAAKAQRIDLESASLNLCITRGVFELFDARIWDKQLSNAPVFFC